MKSLIWSSVCKIISFKCVFAVKKNIVTKIYYLSSNMKPGEVSNYAHTSAFNCKISNFPLKEFYVFLFKLQFYCLKF